MYDFQISTRLMLSQSFQKWRNMMKFLQKSYIWYYWTYQHANFNILSLCHRKREFDVVLIHNMRMMCFKDWCRLKFLKAESTITCNHLLYIRITSNFVFWWEKWQNVEICMLICSILLNINFLVKLLYFWKNWGKIGHNKTKRTIAMEYIRGVSNLLSSVQFSSYAAQIENASMHQPHVTQ